MRGFVALAACLLILPAAVGQPLPETLEGTDPAGDVQAFSADGLPMGPAPGQDFLDVTGARVAKHSSNELLFALGIVDPEGLWLRSDTNLGISARLHFVFGQVHYFVEYADRDETCVHRYVSDDRSDPMHCSTPEVQGDEIVAIVASVPITDLAGASLRHPAQLSEVWAEAKQRWFPTPGLGALIGFVDRAPDTEVWGGLQTPVDPGAGPLLLTPIQSSRGSNGGGGVLLFEIVADNIDAQAIDALLAINGLPPTWSGLVPARLHLEPGESRTIPLLVTTPFAHDHGSSVDFTLSAEVVGRQTLTQDLRVHFFDVPQPAGHHPSLFLHSEPTGPGASNPVASWLDTLHTNEKDHQLPFGPWWGANDYNSATNTDFFFIDMNPDLGIGLDFDLTRKGNVNFALRSDLAVTVSGTVRLEHCNPADTTGRDYAEYRGDMRCPGTWLPVLESSSQTLDLSETPLPVDLELTPTQYADLLPYQQGALMALVMEFEYPLVQAYGNSVEVVPSNGRIDLPLFEFQPPLTGTLASLGDLEILGGEIERSAGPGSRLVMSRSVVNHGEQALDVELETIGYNAAWVHVVPKTLRLGSGEQLPFEVLVDVPTDAGALDYAQTYVVASSQGANDVVAVLPMRINAEGPEIQEAPTSSKGDRKQSPLPPGNVIFIALLALALVRRRRPTP